MTASQNLISQPGKWSANSGWSDRQTRPQPQGATCLREHAFGARRPFSLAASTTCAAVMKTPGATAKAVPKKSGRAISPDCWGSIATTGKEDCVEYFDEGRRHDREQDLGCQIGCHRGPRTPRFGNFSQGSGEPGGNRPRWRARRAEPRG
jgi:hypothetical protein